MNKKWLFWTEVGVLAVVVVCLILCGLGQKGHPGKNAAIVVVYALAGQLTAGFPKNLVLDNSVAMSDSYSITYSSTANQYTAEWISASSSDALYNEYHSYVAMNGWTITNQANGPALKGIYATNATANINIVILPQAQDKGAKMTITYVKSA